jgi:hypothetical protein
MLKLLKNQCKETNNKANQRNRRSSQREIERLLAFKKEKDKNL